MLKSIVFFIASISVINCYADNRTTLYDFRYWTSPEHTRIVIDVEKGVKYNIETKSKYINLNVENAKLLNRTFKKIFFKDKRIYKTNIRREDNILRLFFRTKEQFNVKSYTLKPNSKYKHHRLVIDLYDKILKTAISKTKTEKKPTQKINKSKSERKTILIDAGHGGEDPGAIGYNKSKEKFITLQIAKKLTNKLNKTKGYRAILTRKSDYYVPLTKRVRIAQANDASLFVSIHADSVNSRTANGASVYTLSEKGGATKFAKQLEQSQNIADQFGGVESIIDGDKYLNEILLDFSRKDRDIQSQKLATKILYEMNKIIHLHKKKPQKAGFVVLKTPAIPSVLVETAFISNPTDERRLNSSKEQDKIASAIYKGIVNYYN
jgi:N-acetylmuramoyl-L-alanine amidase